MNLFTRAQQTPPPQKTELKIFKTVMPDACVSFNDWAQHIQRERNKIAEQDRAKYHS